MAYSNPPSHESTPSLLARAKKGDRAAIEAVVERHYQRLRRWVHARGYARRIPGPEDTDDLTQHAFSALNFARIESERSLGFQTYLQRSAKNRAIDLVRNRARQKLASLPEQGLQDGRPSPLELLLGAETLRLYGIALARLPAHERRLVVYRIEERLSFQEIAKREGKTYDAVRMAAKRAILKLGVALRAVKAANRRPEAR